ncbi:Non-ribosomal peptide synthetase protein, partial [Maublancomyces gigas]
MSDVPTDRPRSSTAGIPRYLRSVLPDKLYQSVRDFSALYGDAPYAIFLGALQVYLSRYTAQSDIVIGMLAPHRGGKVSDMSADILPVGTEDIGSRSFRNLLEHIRASLSVQTKSTSEANATSPSNGADFQILFSYRSANDEPGTSLHVLNAAQSPRYELFLEVIEQDDSFVFYLRYDASLFDAPTVERIQHQYFRLLESILAAPDLFPEDYSILPDKDLQDVIHEWNKTKFEYPADTCFHELFEIQS